MSYPDLKRNASCFNIIMFIIDLKLIFYIVKLPKRFYQKMSDFMKMSFWIY